MQRQYTGTAGRIENARSRLPDLAAGRARADRPGAVPAGVVDGDPARCAAAGIPAGTAFATKPALAWDGRRALDAGAPATGSAGDEVYGADPGLRAGLEGRGIGYVLAVAQPPGGHRRGRLRARGSPPRAARRVLAAASAGQGAKGHGYYTGPGSLEPGRPGSASC